jgi:hypothetical protein
MKACQFRVTLLVTPSHSFFDGSGMVRGLSDLARDRTIQLKMRAGKLFDPGHSGLIRLDVTKEGDQRQRQVAIDLADRADYFSKMALEEVDVYFKRSFATQAIEKLPAVYQQRVKPYGLNLTCLGASAARWHLRAALIVLAQRAHSHSKSISQALAEFLHNCRLVGGLHSSRYFRGSGDTASGDSVILQTRIWPPEPSTDDLASVNAKRIALVQKLRTAFGERFVGGIIADEFSKTVCPADTLVRTNKRRSAYIRLVRAAGIGVYTRGLHHAIAIKMAEYLAAGLGIVSEPLSHELPVPLVAGVNYLPFCTYDECVARCEWLFSHRTEATRMRRANLEYYRKWVEPRAHVYDLLSRSFE